MINYKDDLNRAIRDNEIYVCYQPLIEISKGKITGLEALCRWKHPAQGIVSPMEFIPIAEETGLIIPIGEIVLQEACKQLKDWHNAGYLDLYISVNVSAVQLHQLNFADVVKFKLTEAELLPEYLVLEITENVSLISSQTVIDNLNEIMNLGVKISIDDFGTGYNSFIYLQKFKVNGLKIDRSFVSNLNNEINRAIIDMIITLGHRINIEVTAEGVETVEQYEYLKSLGCHKVQGFYFSKPLLPDKMVELFDNSEFN